jgi:hypothetical protein
MAHLPELVPEAVSSGAFSEISLFRETTGLLADWLAAK